LVYPIVTKEKKFKALPINLIIFSKYYLKSYYNILLIIS